MLLRYYAEMNVKEKHRAHPSVVERGTLTNMVKHDCSSVKTSFEIFISEESFDQQRIEEISNCKHFSPIIDNCQV
ncbi:hypothetical protein SLEP1_g45468 [Rubroshorea leprosula]|uniref:Uncharacterized protein n=1 Tax=Rubroshorea leprosula TaxID=152421 RepID=A0AAV5LLQ4_9ROSI|nr:hypothetical protein SLEP1_g45468 [Rubroshorea leprosula]